MANNKWLNIIFILISILAIIAGGLIRSETLKALSGVLIGGGAGLFGVMVSNLVNQWIEAKNPEYRHKVSIDSGDERNQAINAIAKSKAFNAFSPIFGVLMLVFVLIDVAMLPILLLVAAYVAVYGMYFYQIAKLQKEM